jgi:hypothetical protein
MVAMTAVVRAVTEMVAPVVRETGAGAVTGEIVAVAQVEIAAAVTAAVVVVSRVNEYN